MIFENISDVKQLMQRVTPEEVETLATNMKNIEERIEGLNNDVDQAIQDKTELSKDIINEKESAIAMNNEITKNLNKLKEISPKMFY